MLGIKSKFIKKVRPSQRLKASPQRNSAMNKALDGLSDCIFITDHFDLTGASFNPDVDTSVARHAPFKNFLIRGKSNLVDDEEAALDMAVRVDDTKPEGITIDSYWIVDGRSCFASTIVVDHSTGEVDMVYPKTRDLTDHLVDARMYMASLKSATFRLLDHAMDRLAKFEVKATYVQLPNTIIHRRMTEETLATYTEYTIDLTKPRGIKNEPLGGKHASPREHVRRGHYRVSRKGVRYWVVSTIVNKGSKRGKVDKDYTYGVK